MRRLRILTVAAVFLAGLIFYFKNRQPLTIAADGGLLPDKTWMQKNEHPFTAARDIRPPDQTFLTFPEWFLVFSPAEQANYFSSHTSTTFPYRAHIAQLWDGYGIVYDQVKGNYKFNTGYHCMIMVIGVSTTVEYGIKTFYELLIGRLTDTRGGDFTEEDRFNAAYMRDYVDFIEDTPWYAYDFHRQLRLLWGSTSFSGRHLLRKIERRYYLSTELLVKGAYGWMIGLGTKSAYDVALLNTAVVVDKIPSVPDPEVSHVRQLASGLVSMDLPRYARFNPAVCRLAAQGVGFQEIAGNKGAIMLSVLGRNPVLPDTCFKVLFVQPIVTKPGLNRMVLVTTVGNLTHTVQKLTGNKIVIEHIYDY